MVKEGTENENLNQVVPRTEEQQKRANELYDSYRDEVRKRQLSNNENYDKTILSLSSAGLALSLTAIRFVVPLEIASYLDLIKWSWWLFGITIFISIVAYFVSNKALDRQLEIAERYYEQGHEEAFNEKNGYSDLNNLLNKMAGLTFLIATAFIISFVTFNIDISGTEMKQKSDKIALDSASVPKMQSIAVPVRVKGSAEVPAMQLAPKTSPLSQQSKQNPDQNSPNKK